MQEIFDYFSFLWGNPYVTAIFCAGLFIFLVNLWQSPVKSTVKGRVSWVCDGDTVYVNIGWFRRIKVRVAGEDAPEHGQAYGEEARIFLKKLVGGKRVKVQIVDVDRYGRYVGIITVGRTDAGYEILRAGLAWCYFTYLKNLPPQYASTYRKVAAEARSARRGLWRDKNPVPPWDWRKTQRKRLRLLGFAKIIVAVVVIVALVVWIYLMQTGAGI